MKERRFKIMHLQADMVMTLLAGWRQVDFIRLPVLQEVPEDAEVCGVHFNVISQGFAVVMWHPSFPIVEDGVEAPVMLGHTETVELARADLPRPRLATGADVRGFIDQLWQRLMGEYPNDVPDSRWAIALVLDLMVRWEDREPGQRRQFLAELCRTVPELRRPPSA